MAKMTLEQWLYQDEERRAFLNGREIGGAVDCLGDVYDGIWRVWFMGGGETMAVQDKYVLVEVEETVPVGPDYIDEAPEIKPGRDGSGMKFSQVTVSYLRKNGGKDVAWISWADDPDGQANAYVEDTLPDGSMVLRGVFDVLPLADGSNRYLVVAVGATLIKDRYDLAYIYLGDEISADPEATESSFVEWIKAWDLKAEAREVA